MYPNAGINPAAVAAAAAARHPGPPQPGQPFKFTVNESCDRIKEEFNFLQAQCHSLKLECEKMATEKIELQRHYVMYYEMSYGLNVEMHKQTEIAKRLNGIIAQILPYLSQDHQQQVANTVERAKQVTIQELNSVVGARVAGERDRRDQGENRDDRRGEKQTDRSAYYPMNMYYSVNRG